MFQMQSWYNVTKGGVRKAIKKRGKAHHQTYAKLKDVIRNAQYVGFEKNDVCGDIRCHSTY